MIKKSLLGAALGAGTLFLVFGTDTPSYVKTAFQKVRQAVKGAVNLQFEIDRAKAEIANLQRPFDENKETLARAEHEAEQLEREIHTAQTNLGAEKQTILALRDKVKNGDFRLTGRYNVTADELAAQLEGRLKHYKATEGTLKEKQETLKAKRNTIEAARQQFENIREQQSTLKARLAHVEAKLRMLEATHAKNEVIFDDSHLSRANKIVSDLEETIDIMDRKAKIEESFGDLNGSSTCVKPAQDVVKEVDDTFSQPAAPKTADKSS